MSISSKVKALLSIRDKKQSDLIQILGVGSKQSLSNKFTHDRWSAADLAAVAELCDCKLAFVLPDGQQIIIDDAGEKKNEALGQ